MSSKMLDLRARVRQPLCSCGSSGAGAHGCVKSCDGATHGGVGDEVESDRPGVAPAAKANAAGGSWTGRIVADCLSGALVGTWCARGCHSLPRETASAGRNGAGAVAAAAGNRRSANAGGREVPPDDSTRHSSGTSALEAGGKLVTGVWLAQLDRQSEPSARHSPGDRCRPAGGRAPPRVSGGRGARRACQSQAPAAVAATMAATLGHLSSTTTSGPAFVPGGLRAQGDRISVRNPIQTRAKRRG